MPDTPTPTPTPAPTPAPAAPAKSGNRVIIVIVCVIVGFFLLIGGCVATCTYLAAKKAREISRAAQKNPVYASLSLAASLNPDVEVLSKDEDSGKITVRNKRTGETTTIDSNDYTKENIGQALEKMTQGLKAAAATAAAASAHANEQLAQASSAAAPSTPEPTASSAEEPAISSGKAAAMASILEKFPDYVPAYPGGTTVVASQNSVGTLRSDKYVFVTPDKLDAVVDFYEKKATGAGFTVMGRTGDTNDYGPTMALSLLHANPQGTITVNAESKQGGAVQVSIEVSEVSN